MTKEGYLALAISILVALVIVFVVSFVLYQRTPVPKGCEHLKVNEENCSTCGQKQCPHYVNKEEEK